MHTFVLVLISERAYLLCMPPTFLPWRLCLSVLANYGAKSSLGLPTAIPFAQEFTGIGSCWSDMSLRNKIFHWGCTALSSYSMESTTRVPLNEARHHSDNRGSAFHPFLSPLASMILAGMQYTGSKSTRPGYPKRDRPIEASRSTTLTPRRVLFV